MAEESTTGAIALGLIVAGVGIIAIDYATSEPGNSWFDQIKSKLSSKGEGPHALPPGKSLGEHRALPPRPAGRMAPPVVPLQVSPPRAPRSPMPRARAPVMRTPVARAPIAPPSTISPELVKETARQLNAAFGTKLRADGIITREMQQTIKSVQQQLGLPLTGYPDWRLLAQLGIMQDAAKPSVVTDAAKVISKTFGGPPSTPKTGPDDGVKKTQQMLNAYFKNKVLDDDGYLGPRTTGAIREFQKAEKLPDTGTMDSATYDLLVKRVSGESSSWLSDAASRFFHKTGAAGGDDWKAETQDLPQLSQDVLAKIISSESNVRTLRSVGKVLGAAGYPKAAAAVLAKAPPVATTGFFPDPYYGYYPLTHGPYGWSDPYGSYGQW